MDCGPKAGTFGYLELALKGSADEFLDHGAAKLGELFVATGVEVGELIIVEAEEGAVEVADGAGDVDGLGADVVGSSDDGTFLTPPPAIMMVMASALWPRPIE